MLELSLFENGLHSLKMAKKEIEGIEMKDYWLDASLYNIKNSIIFLNHGCELLLKYILSNENEAFLFSNLDSYMTAKEQFNKQYKEKSSFKIGFGELLKQESKIKLKTVSLLDALRRVEILCDKEVDDNLKNSILFLNKYRNDLTHHSFYVDQKDMRRLFKILLTISDKLDWFFSEYIEGYKILSDTHDENIQLTEEEWEELNEEMRSYYHNRVLNMFPVNFQDDDL